MSVPVAEHILRATAACCAIPNGVAPYENDLTAAGLVAIDERIVAPAQVIVALPDISRDPAIRLLAHTDRVSVLYVMAAVGMAANYEARTIAAMRLQNDLARAIDTNFYTQLNLLQANLSNQVQRKELTLGQQSGLTEHGLGALLLIFTVAYRVPNFTGF